MFENGTLNKWYIKKYWKRIKWKELDKKIIWLIKKW